jgi:hypothetical protein
MRAKRTLQILKLNDRDLRTSGRLECRRIFERSSIRLRHRNLRTSRNNRDNSQHQNKTIHANHSSGHVKAHVSFQSTTRLLTLRVKWNQTPTVRPEAGLHHLTHHENQPKSKAKVFPSEALCNKPREGEAP